jgi:hypothetical protein
MAKLDWFERKSKLGCSAFRRWSNRPVLDPLSKTESRRTVLHQNKISIHPKQECKIDKALIDASSNFFGNGLTSEISLSCTCPQSFRDYVSGVHAILKEVKNKRTGSPATEQWEIVSRISL